MLGGLDAYGSDDSDSESSQQQTLPLPALVASTSKKPSLSLPPPTKAPLKGRSKRPIFTVAKPSKSTSDDDSDGRERPTKKPRLDSRTGAGSSSLLAMLPAPSKNPPVRAPPPRVLGSASQAVGGTGVIMSPSMDTSSRENDLSSSVEYAAVLEGKSTTLLPPSLVKGKAKSTPIAMESKPAPSVPAVDFFSLGTSTSRSPPTVSAKKATELPVSSSSAALTSAPIVPTFEPPPPTPSDPYPGYYQLPSGQWAAYEPEFYKRHYEMWSASLDLDGTAQKGFEGAQRDDTVEIDAQEQLDLARKEREEKKALTKDANGGPTAPKMNIKAPKIGSRARTRHQLSALLTEAYENREALEEKIAQGRRNRKEAGNKYGF